MPGTCVAVVSHILNPPVRGVFERMCAEAPPDHDVRMILSADDPKADLSGLSEEQVDRISLDQVMMLPYPQKCRLDDWEMAGNLDVVFLEFFRRYPDYDWYWFSEYDVYWQGHWSVFFDHFYSSEADLLAASIHQVDEVPHKAEFTYPRQVIPAGMKWDRPHVNKAFLPICRLSRRAMQALDQAYRAGLGGHYEINVPSVVAQQGWLLEDYGGNGLFVRKENVDRFYFARPDTYTHSPGNFVFRPAQRALPRENTLWHPVKPEGVPAWHPLLLRGNVLKTNWEQLKPYISRAVIRWWFATRWRPLPTPAPGSGRGRPAG